MRLVPPNHRIYVIRGLRMLAAQLSMNPDIPVPLIVEINYHPRGDTDEEKHAEIDRIGELLNVTPQRTPHGHYYVIKQFDAVHFKAVTVPSWEMDRFRALSSYEENIIIDETAHEEPPAWEAS